MSKLELTIYTIFGRDQSEVPGFSPSSNRNAQKNLVPIFLQLTVGEHFKRLMKNQLLFGPLLKERSPA